MHYGAGYKHRYARLQKISIDEGSNADQVFQDAFYTDDNMIIIHDFLKGADCKRRTADWFNRNLCSLAVSS